MNAPLQTAQPPKPVAVSRPPANAKNNRVLQRKCACSGTPGPSGECAECRRRRSHEIGSRTLGLQTKLAVNTPGDRYEQEADRVADKVMRMPTADLMRSATVDQQARPLQIQRLATAPGPATAPPSVEATLSSPGQTLDTGTRQFMEQRFGHDFGQVRIHADDRAAASADDVEARAYTVGADVVFGQGQYAPGTETGRHLLAHELTHVVQQSGNSLGTSIIQRWSYGTGTHGTVGGNTFRELTTEEREGSNGMDAAMQIVDRLVSGNNDRARTCQQWYVDNCPIARSLTDLNSRANIWIWRIADGASGNGLTDGGAREHHAITEQLFNRKSRWALAATILHEYWHDCESGQPDIGDDAKTACGLPNI